MTNDVKLKTGTGVEVLNLTGEAPNNLYDALQAPEFIKEALLYIQNPVCENFSDNITHLVDQVVAKDPIDQVYMHIKQKYEELYGYDDIDITNLQSIKDILICYLLTETKYKNIASLLKGIRNKTITTQDFVGQQEKASVVPVAKPAAEEVREEKKDVSEFGWKIGVPDDLVINDGFKKEIKKVNTSLSSPKTKELPKGEQINKALHMLNIDPKDVTCHQIGNTTGYRLYIPMVGKPKSILFDTRNTGSTYIYHGKISETLGSQNAEIKTSTPGYIANIDFIGNTGRWADALKGYLTETISDTKQRKLDENSTKELHEILDRPVVSIDDIMALYNDINKLYLVSYILSGRNATKPEYMSLQQALESAHRYKSWAKEYNDDYATNGMMIPESLGACIRKFLDSSTANITIEGGKLGLAIVDLYRENHKLIGLEQVKELKKSIPQRKKKKSAE